MRNSVMSHIKAKEVDHIEGEEDFGTLLLGFFFLFFFGIMTGDLHFWL